MYLVYPAPPRIYTSSVDASSVLEVQKLDATHNTHAQTFPGVCKLCTSTAVL